MPESIRTRLARLRFNLLPAFLGTGAWITYISDDWHEIRVRLPLSWRTRNLVGTIFGGSTYACADPFYMAMLMRLLGENYVVWDKAARVSFCRPGRSTLYAEFLIPRGEIDEIQQSLTPGNSTNRTYSVDLVDAQGEVHAAVVKTIYIKQKS